MSDKINFKPKTVKHNKTHYKMIKGSTYQEDVTITNMYTLIIGAPTCIKQMLTDLEGKKDNIIVIETLTAHFQPRI